MDPMLWTNGSDRLNRLPARCPKTTVFLALSSIYKWVEKKQPMILPKKWCEHRNYEDFLVETTPLVETSPWCFDQFLSSTTSHEVPTVGFLLQSQAMVKNTECPGERAKHFLFFFGGGGGKEGKLRAKHLEILKLKERHCFFFLRLRKFVCVCVNT